MISWIIFKKKIIRYYLVTLINNIYKEYKTVCRLDRIEVSILHTLKFNIRKKIIEFLSDT